MKINLCPGKLKQAVPARITAILQIETEFAHRSQFGCFQSGGVAFHDFCLCAGKIQPGAVASCLPRGIDPSSAVTVIAVKVAFAVFAA